MREDATATPRQPRVKVLGIGGGGGNAINHMADEGVDGAESVAVNADITALRQSRATIRIQIGKRRTRGLGVGGQPDIGREALEESREEVHRAIRRANLLILLAGLGGGVGTGAAPLIGAMAREIGLPTVAIVTYPFSFEGNKREQQAKQGLMELRGTTDAGVVVSLEEVLRSCGRGASLKDALREADRVLLRATRVVLALTEGGRSGATPWAFRTAFHGRGAADLMRRADSDMQPFTVWGSIPFS